MRKYFKHLGVEGETERSSATKPLGEVASEKKRPALEREADDTEGKRPEGGKQGREFRVKPRVDMEAVSRG